jgi:hypothetical protein
LRPDKENNRGSVENQLPIFLFYLEDMLHPTHFDLRDALTQDNPKKYEGILRISCVPPLSAVKIIMVILSAMSRDLVFNTPFDRPGSVSAWFT